MFDILIENNDEKTKLVSNSPQTDVKCIQISNDELFTNFKSLLREMKSLKVNEFISLFKKLKAKHQNEENDQKICEMGANFQDNCAHFLYEAIERGIDGIVKFLIDDGIDVQRIPNKDPNIVELGCNHFSDTANATPLHYAVRFQNKFAILKLLEKGANFTALNKYGKTSLENIKPDVLNEFLNDSISVVPKKQKEIHIDVTCFMKAESEMKALEIISNKNELRPLLKHPTILCIIFFKWMLFSPIFYCNLAVFGILISLFVTYLLHYNLRYDEDKIIFLKIASIAMVILYAARELIIYLLSVNTHFKSKSNWFKMIFLIFAILSLAPIDDRRFIHAFTILLTITEYFHLIGQLPFLSLSTNIKIFLKVSLNYIKTIALYTFLLFMFAFSFVVLKSGMNASTNNDSDEDDDDDSFKSLIDGSFKVIFMFFGEFEGEDLNLPLQSLSFQLIFIIFIFFVPLVLLNMLNAFAIEEASAIRNEGELADLAGRIKLLARYEDIFGGNVNICGKRIAFFDWIKGHVMMSPNCLKDGKIIMINSFRMKTRLFNFIKGIFINSTNCLIEEADKSTEEYTFKKPGKNGFFVLNGVKEEVVEKFDNLIDERREEVLKNQIESYKQDRENCEKLKLCEDREKECKEKIIYDLNDLRKELGRIFEDQNNSSIDVKIIQSKIMIELDNLVKQWNNY